MDMGTSSMDMGGVTATATGTVAAANTAAAMDMGGGCQISMLWNWYTIDSCTSSSLLPVIPVDRLQNYKPSSVSELLTTM
ncbi:hypothetical protein BPAE_0083g00230 [Botrytis paeoniae]|uniref:Uncharacterized protein n=1 Tax=Botrytis paeoniae TaxID=278948 RepID=A0A4Z1FPI1_9HELO|nr:hypothetical protein BPAE_0083g00230 [Botrytis paeoniae]